MSIAISYANALLEVMREQGATSAELDRLERDFGSLIQAKKSLGSLSDAWIAPVVSVQEKLEMVQGISEKLGLDTTFKNFLSLLAKKDRLSLLESIYDAWGSVRLESEGGMAGKLVSADPMSETDVESLAKAFEKRLGKKVAFRVSTDPSLLAGVKVTVNGVTYDGSLRSQLQKLRDCFVAGTPGAQA